MTADGSTAFVAVGVANELVRVDLNSKLITGRLAVGREPRGVALSPDESHFSSGTHGHRTCRSSTSKAWKITKTIPIDGDNLRQVAISPDGKFGYIANMKNRRFPTTKNNIDLGWVLGQRLTRIALDGSETFATLSLDTQGKAASDAHGVAVSRDQKFVAVSCGGTHEVMIFQTDLRPLPWRANSSRDLIAPELLKKDGRHRRVLLGGRPTELAFAPRGNLLYVANYLSDAIQVVDAESAKLVQTIPLGSPRTISLERKGEIVFHDASHSFNQWYSCNTCHSDGHTGGLDFDTLNDGRQDLSTFPRPQPQKGPDPSPRDRDQTVDLARLAEQAWTTPRSSHSPRACKAQSPRPNDVTIADCLSGHARISQEPVSQSRRQPDRPRPSAVARSSSRPRPPATPATAGAELTDGRIHEVGLEERDDAYRGYNPPSLRGLYDKDPYLHDGRAKTLREALSGPHSADNVTGLGEISDQELDDLIAYLKTL